MSPEPKPSEPTCSRRWRTVPLRELGLQARAQAWYRRPLRLERLGVRPDGSPLWLVLEGASLIRAWTPRRASLRRAPSQRPPSPASVARALVLVEHATQTAVAICEAIDAGRSPLPVALGACAERLRLAMLPQPLSQEEWRAYDASFMQAHPDDPTPPRSTIVPRWVHLLPMAVQIRPPQRPAPRVILTRHRRPGRALRAAAWATEWRRLRPQPGPRRWRSYPGARASTRAAHLSWQGRRDLRARRSCWVRLLPAPRDPSHKPHPPTVDRHLLRGGVWPVNPWRP